MSNIDNNEFFKKINVSTPLDSKEKEFSKMLDIAYTDPHINPDEVIEQWANYLREVKA
jgi:hypothetical protein